MAGVGAQRRSFNNQMMWQTHTAIVANDEEKGEGVSGGGGRGGQLQRCFMRKMWRKRGGRRNNGVALKLKY